MAKKQFWLVLALLASSWTLGYAMGHKMDKDADDQEFNAKAVGTTPDPHISDATKEDSPVGLPAAPNDVEKDTAKGFHDPFFKDTDKDPDLENNDKKD
jgi:hypothetical protein